jgi:hypothetical protein
MKTTSKNLGKTTKGKPAQPNQGLRITVRQRKEAAQIVGQIKVCSAAYGTLAEDICRQNGLEYPQGLLQVLGALHTEGIPL